MALWDAAAAAAGLPSPDNRFLRRRLGWSGRPSGSAYRFDAGAYPHPHDDRRLEELRRFARSRLHPRQIRHRRALPDQDRRQTTGRRVLGDALRLAVDAMNRYDAGVARSRMQLKAPKWRHGVAVVRGPSPTDFPHPG